MTPVELFNHSTTRCRQTNFEGRKLAALFFYRRRIKKEFGNVIIKKKSEMPFVAWFSIFF